MRLAWPIVLAFAALLTSGARAEAPSEEISDRRPVVDASRVVTEPQKAAVRRGLAYLAGTQEKDGAWGSRHAPIAVTALCTLAFLAGGNTETRGLYSANVTAGVNYLLRHVDMDPNTKFQRGYIHGGDSDPTSRLHGHAYAVLALSEAYGGARRGLDKTGQDRRFREKLVAAVRLIERSQERRSGGWYYLPEAKSDQHEGSVTVCQIQALRAARGVGIRVDGDVIARALKYVKQSQNKEGGFVYSLRDRSVHSYELTAAAVSTLNGVGDYGSTAYRRGLDYLMRRLDQNLIRPRYFFYGNFYAAQAMWQTEKRSGYWGRYWPKVRERLLDAEARDLETDRPLGKWVPSEVQPATTLLGPDYGTAMACLILQIPYGYLPLFQR